MKTLYKNSFKLVILSMLFLMNACTSEFADLNTDPKLVTDELIKPGLLLTKVLKYSIFDIQNTGNVGEIAGYTYNQATGQKLVIQYGGYGDYNRYIANLNSIIRVTKDDETLSNENAIARIWKVYVFHRMTDTMGDIPYFETGKAPAEANVAPPYDTQEEIYNDMLNELKEAASALSNESNMVSFGEADILFGGNVDKWRKFANSLRLRLAIRVRYVDPSLAQANISDVIGSSLISTNADNASMTSEGVDATDPNNADNWNPIFGYEVAGNLNRSHPSFTVSDNLIRTDDPRLPILIQPDATTGYRCAPLNLSPEEKPRYVDVALYSSIFRDPVYTFNVITAAEVSFLRAEAALAGLTGENANELYMEGITLSMEQYKVSDADVATFLASATGTLSGTDEQQLEQIIVQKYFAIIMNPYEAWAEYRRTGYPRIWIGSDATTTNGQIQRRFQYPENEYLLNSANVTEAAARYPNGDDVMSKVWWDVKPGLPFAHPKQGMFPPDDY